MTRSMHGVSFVRWLRADLASVVILGLCAATAVGLGAAVVVWSTSFRLIAPALATAMLLIVGWRRLSPSALSPVKIVVLGYMAAAILGLAFYDRVASAPNGAGIRLYPSHGAQLATAQILFVAALTVVTGALLVLGLLPRTEGISGRFRPVVASRRTMRRILLVSMVPAVLTILERTPDDLLRRATYLPPQAGSAGFASIGPSLSVPALLAMGYIIAVGTKRHRLVATVLTVVYSLEFFALGSRRMTLIPLLLAGGALAGSLSWRTKLGVVVGSALTFALSPLPIYLRSLPAHGLIPYGRAIPDYLGTPMDFKSSVLSILIVFAVTGTVAYSAPPIPLGDLFVELNPLPGVTTNWYAIQPGHELNIFTPYSALGELRNYGLVVFVGYCLVAGGVLGYLDYRVRQLLLAGRQIFAIALVGLAGLFLLFSLEYFLRTATRFIYYAIVIDIAVRFLADRRQRLRDRRVPPVETRQEPRADVRYWRAPSISAGPDR